MSPVQARSIRAVEEILDAARERFGRVGYGATSVEDIAADAGRTKGSVYHHFADKHALFEQVFLREQRRIAAEVAGAGDLRGGVAAYLRTIAGAPQSARITLVDGPVVLGWAAWRSCDDGPFRSMLRASLEPFGPRSDLGDLDALTDLLLGAVTEAAVHVAQAPRSEAAPTARRYGAQLDRVLVAALGLSQGHRQT